jgi:hypothetical protein
MACPEWRVNGWKRASLQYYRDVLGLSDGSDAEPYGFSLVENSKKELRTYRQRCRPRQRLSMETRVHSGWQITFSNEKVIMELSEVQG